MAVRVMAQRVSSEGGAAVGPGAKADSTGLGASVGNSTVSVGIGCATDLKEYSTTNAHTHNKQSPITETTGPHIEKGITPLFG